MDLSGQFANRRLASDVLDFLDLAENVFEGSGEHRLPVAALWIPQLNSSADQRSSAKVGDEFCDDRGGRADVMDVADTFARIHGHCSDIALHIQAGRRYGEPSNGAALAVDDLMSYNLAVESFCSRDG